MHRSRSVTLGLLTVASLGTIGTASMARFKGLESILVTSESLPAAVPIDSLADLRALCNSIRVTNAVWLKDSTLPPAAKDTSGAIYLTFYGHTYRADIPPEVHVAVVRPPAKPGALGMITMLPGSDDVATPDQFCNTGVFIVDRVNPNAPAARPGVFVMNSDGAAVLRRYGVLAK